MLVDHVQSTYTTNERLLKILHFVLSAQYNKNNNLYIEEEQFLSLKAIASIYRANDDVSSLLFYCARVWIDFEIHLQFVLIL